MTVHDPDVRIPTGRESVNADLTIPQDARGIIVFAHGSGSSRHSPRNTASADELNRNGFATLLADLLTMNEEARDEWTREYRFDIELLARRVVDVIDWVLAEPRTRDLAIGGFGASTGAAAALVAAARRPEQVRAVVSRGGRPDLAGESLRSVWAPTLLIVGSLDIEVLDLNRVALRELPGPSALEIVPGATHLFPEPGALERVNQLAVDWFARYVTKTGS
ncbi:MAG: alpha/beta fold hydrolase [Gemmatimonadota bacterium]